MPRLHPWLLQLRPHYWLWPLLVLLPATAFAQVVQSDQPAIKQITIGAWAVTTDDEAGASASGSANPPRWRNTFGGERKTARWRKIATNSVDADIVVLQQLKSLSDVRQLFPARTHQLIASRAALASANRRTAAIAGDQLPPPVVTYDSFPAIAVRRRRGIRLTSIRNFTTTIPSQPEQGSIPTRRYTAFATRILVSGRILWVMTPVTSARCDRSRQAETSTETVATNTCPTSEQDNAAVTTWLNLNADRNIPVVVAKVSQQQASNKGNVTSAKPNKTADPATDNQSGKEDECHDKARVRIEPAFPVPNGVADLGPQKPSASRPCAAVAVLTFRE